LQEVLKHPPVPVFSLPTRRSEEDSIDPREIDKVLTEVAGMAGRWNLFKKFLTENLASQPGEEDKEGDDEPVTTVEVEQKIDWASTQSWRIFDDLLSSYYIPLEVWYIRTIIDKAHRLSTADVSQLIPVTTTPDDVFYILKIMFVRLLSTGSLSAVERMFEQMRDVMERDYVGIMKKKLDDVYRGAGAMGGGAREREKVERENRVAFITILNDLDVSSSHMDRLMRDLATNPTIGQHFLTSEQGSVKSQITAFATLATKFRSTLRVGIEQLFNQLMRPKLRNLITEVWKDVSYVLDDDAYSAAEYQDVPRKRFIKVWEGLMESYKVSFVLFRCNMSFDTSLGYLQRHKLPRVFRAGPRCLTTPMGKVHDGLPVH
jgi:hypothetical protein